MTLVATAIFALAVVYNQIRADQ